MPCSRQKLFAGKLIAVAFRRSFKIIIIYFLIPSMVTCLNYVRYRKFKPVDVVSDQGKDEMDVQFHDTCTELNTDQIEMNDHLLFTDQFLNSESHSLES